MPLCYKNVLVTLKLRWKNDPTCGVVSHSVSWDSQLLRSLGYCILQASQTSTNHNWGKAEVWLLTCKVLCKISLVRDGSNNNFVHTESLMLGKCLSSCAASFSKGKKGHFMQYLCLGDSKFQRENPGHSTGYFFSVQSQRGTAEPSSLCFAFLYGKIAWAICKVCKWGPKASLGWSPVGYVKWDEDSGPYLMLLLNENWKSFTKQFLKCVLILYSAGVASRVIV